MRDQLDRHFVHPPLEPALGDEAVAEARSRQIVGKPEADAAGDHDRIRALRQRHVAGDRAEAEAQPVKRGIGEALLKHVVATARAEGVLRITLLTDMQNERAQAMYRRVGFVGSPMKPMRMKIKQVGTK